MFTLKELPGFLKDFKTDKRISNAALFKTLFEKAIVHTREASPEPVLKSYRINETEHMLRRRLALYEAITAYIYEDAFRNISSALDYKLVAIDCEEKTKGLMNELEFWNFFYSELIQAVIDDPNGYLVVMPIVNKDAKIEAKFWVVNSFNVVEKNEEYMIFYKEDYFYFLSKNFVTRFYVDEDNNTIICVDNTKDDFYFVTFGESPLTYIPAKKLKGKITQTSNGSPYYKSYFSSSFAHANKAIKMDSDWVVDLISTNSTKIIKTKPCGNECNEGYVYDNGTKNTCPSCNGTGLDTFNWGINDVFTVKSEGDDFLDEIQLDQIAKFLTPPTEYIKLRDEYTDKALAKAEKALNQVDIYMNQSGTAKDLDLRGRDALINVIGENMFSIAQFAYQAVQDFTTLSNNRKVVTILIPDDFRATTTDSLLLRVENLKAKGMPTGLLYPTLRRLYNMLYNKEPISRKIAIIELDYDKLHIYESVNEKKQAADSMYSFELSIQLSSALARVAKQMGKESFILATDKEIFEKAKELMDLPNKQTQITDDNGNSLSL